MEVLKELIGSKNYVAGIRQFERLLAENKIEKAYLAVDADESFKQKVLKNAQTAGVAVTVAGTRKEFAAHCNIRVGCAVIGILK